MRPYWGYYETLCEKGAAAEVDLGCYSFNAPGPMLMLK